MIYDFNKAKLFMYLDNAEYKHVIDYYYKYVEKRNDISESVKLATTKELIYQDCFKQYTKQCKYPNLYPIINEFSALEELSKKVKESPAPSTGSGGCYVATAVYGSYDCPEVWTLRRYRDKDLAGTWYGRAFIRVYYATSPTLVRLFGKKKWFNKLWRSKLDKMVSRLQEKGYEATPYEDKQW